MWDRADLYGAMKKTSGIFLIVPCWRDVSAQVMRFFNLAGAKSDLVKGLTESQAFTYAFWTVVLLTTIYNLPQEEALDKGYLVEYVFWILYVLVAAFGYREAYMANGGANGRDFLKRIACLGWVIGFRVLLPFVFVFIGYYVVAESISLDLESQAFVAVESFLSLLIEGLYWFLVSKNMRSLKHLA